MLITTTAMDLPCLLQCVIHFKIQAFGHRKLNQTCRPYISSTLFSSAQSFGKLWKDQVSKLVKSLVYYCFWTLDFCSARIALNQTCSFAFHYGRNPSRSYTTRSTSAAKDVPENKQDLSQDDHDTGSIERRGPRKIHLTNRESDEDEDNRRKKRKQEKSNDDPEPRRRLRCPFYLHRPDKHTRGSCRGEGFADMGKLKHIITDLGIRDHLKRVHSKLRQCVRCWDEFTSEDLYVEHTKREDCDQKSEPDDDRISYTVLQHLNFNRIPYANARTVEEKWKIMYRSLFQLQPEDEVPSPYNDHIMGESFDKMLAYSLREEFSKEFGSIFDSRPQDDLEQRMLHIITRCKQAIIVQPISRTLSTHSSAISAKKRVLSEDLMNVEKESSPTTMIPPSPTHSKTLPTSVPRLGQIASTAGSPHPASSDHDSCPKVSEQLDDVSN